MASSDTLDGDRSHETGAITTAESIERPPVRSRPLLIAYDGSPASNYALSEAATLLRGHKALVVTVWKPGPAFELMELPAATIGLPPAPLDIRTALEVDRSLYERAQRMAEQVARVASTARSASARMMPADCSTSAMKRLWSLRSAVCRRTRSATSS